MSPWKVNAGILTMASMYAAGFIATKHIVGYLHPLSISFIRVFSLLVLFAPLAWRRRPKKVDSKSIILLFFSGLAGVGINQILFAMGMQKTTASEATVVVSMIPILTLVVAAILKVEEVTLLRVLGFIISFLGVVYLQNPHAVEWSDTRSLGNLLIFLNALSYSVYLVIAKPLPKKYSSIWITWGIFFFGAFLVFPLGWGHIKLERWSELSLWSWLSIGYLIVFMTLFPYLLSNWLLRYTDSSKIAQGVYLQPVLTILLATMILNEAISTRLMISGLLVLVGVAISRSKWRLHVETKSIP